MTMTLRYAIGAGFVLLAGAQSVQATEVAVCTDRGRAVLELADEQAPLHVANFLRYVDMGFYSGTVFHRVVPGFVVQGGGIDRSLNPRTTLEPVTNESANGLRNVRGSVAAARLEDPDTARAQFFVNLSDNESLDAGRRPGFTVFGHVKEGLEVFDEISGLPTGAAGPFRADVPTPLVAIKSIARLDEAALAAWPADGREAALKSEVLAAAEAGRAEDALRLVGHYRAICGADDPELALTEARVALAADDRRRAILTLEELLATSDAADPTRAAAEALYREALPEAQSAVVTIGDCAAPPPPVLPDATTASSDEMLAAQRQVREFVAAGEAHLKCLAAIIDDDERSAEQRNAAVSEHNRTVAVMEQTAAAFNEQIRIFKARG